LELGVRFHLLHHVHGPAIDYVAVIAAAFASWAGVPGPGESVLIAAGVIAARHKLDISPVLLAAWAGATAGGVAGWLVGMKAGRAVVTAPGPLRRMRVHAVERGDHVFLRLTVIAITLAPSWISGIHRVRPQLYLPVNAALAALWAAGIGLGAYYVGPTVVDFVQDLGWVTVSLLAALVTGAVAAEVLRRRRRTRRQAARAPE
jgi:membrane protein DedA with SNARE-associated domain